MLDLFLDHYAFKPAVRDLLMLRASRPIDELVRTHRVTRIAASILETGGAEGRWYPGALEDMASHVLVMVGCAKVGLENEGGRTLEPSEVVARRQGFFRQLRAEPRDRDLARGQCCGFSASTIETYFAARLRLTSSDWVKVPIIIRSGKYLGTNLATVQIWFENRQLIEARVQPNPFVRLSSITDTGVEARYVDEHPAIDPSEPGPYARVLMELERGQLEWFLTQEEAVAVREWLDAMAQLSGLYRLPLLPYEVGSLGPVRSGDPLLAPPICHGVQRLVSKPTG